MGKEERNEARRRGRAVSHTVCLEKMKMLNYRPFMRNLRISCLSPQSMTMWPSCVSNWRSGFPSEPFAWEKFLPPVFQGLMPSIPLSMICWPMAAIFLWAISLSPLLSQRRLCSRDLSSSCLHPELTRWDGCSLRKNYLWSLPSYFKLRGLRTESHIYAKDMGTELCYVAHGNSLRLLLLWLCHACVGELLHLLQGLRVYGIFPLCTWSGNFLFWQYSHTHTHTHTHKQSLSEPWLTCDYESLAVDVGGASGTLPGSLGLSNWVLDLQVSKESEVLWWK